MRFCFMFSQASLWLLASNQGFFYIYILYTLSLYLFIIMKYNTVFSGLLFSIKWHLCCKVAMDFLIKANVLWCVVVIILLT